MAGDIYWLSITASNGHELIISPTGQWLYQTTTDQPEPEHWWGWHTSPDAFNDVATMSRLGMGIDTEWEYQNWMPIDPAHGLDNMAFELLTIPLPGAMWLFAPALAGLGMLLRRNIA